LPYRELGKYHLMRGYETIRAVLVELARRWELGRDLFFLQRDELPALAARRTELLPRIAERKLRWKSAQKLVLRDVIDSRELDGLGRPDDAAAVEGGGRYEARPIASGAAAGVARVVFDPREAVELGNDYILVCPGTDPGWTPLFVHARGLIVERGGILSHGAIVARDFGIPAVVLEQATRRIPDGARVEIDGSRGLVVFLEQF
jgi:pyruvate,water dikinase